MNPKALTDSQIAEVRQKYTSGISTYDLAEQYYCCRQTIWEYVKDIKDRQRTSKRKLPSERIQQIKNGKSLGTFTHEIARMMNISRQTVWRYTA
jgi:DNA invertase Pin-like site-specific DNA recombinase